MSVNDQAENESSSIRENILQIANPSQSISDIVKNLLSQKEIFSPINGFESLQECKGYQEKTLLEVSAENFARVSKVKGLKSSEDCETRYVMLVTTIVKGLEIPSLIGQGDRSFKGLHPGSSASKVAMRTTEFEKFFQLTKNESELLEALLNAGRAIHRVLGKNEQAKKTCYLSPHYNLLVCLQHFDVQSGWFDESTDYSDRESLYKNPKQKEDRRSYLILNHDKQLWKTILPWIQDELTNLEKEKKVWGWVTGEGRKLFLTGKMSKAPEESEVREWVQSLF